MEKKRNLRQVFTGLTFNLTAAIVVVLLVLCVVACVIGYYRFTDSLTSQYNDAAYHTALTSAAVIDADRIDDYLAHNGEDADHQVTLSRLNLLADKQNTSVIYVIRPNEDYTSYLSVFNSPHDTANQTYVEYYRAMCEDGLQSATVVRDHDLKGAQPHITVMIPLTRSDGTVKDILCVQRFMEELKAGRQKYTIQVFSVILGLTIILAGVAAISTRNNFVRPIHKIITETNRFAAGGAAEDSTLQGKVSGIFEISYLAKEVGSMEKQIAEYTTLCLQYNGPVSDKNTIEVDATDNNLTSVLDFVDARLTSFDKKTRNQMRLAMEEVFVNIAHYAYVDKTGKATVTVTDTDKGVSIEFADSGTPYNPLEKPDPDITLSADERPIGGLGIFLVKKIADKTNYKYVDGKNVFTIEKYKA